jgi:predicted transcriptional regulator
MGRTRTAKSEIVSVSLPVPLADAAEALAKKTDRSRSRVFQDALRQYLWFLRWTDVQQYGISRGIAAGCVPEHVSDIVDAYRTEHGHSSRS